MAAFQSKKSTQNADAHRPGILPLHALSQDLLIGVPGLRNRSATLLSLRFGHAGDVQAGPRIHVSFCGHCRTGVSKIVERDGSAIVFAGTIDDDGKTTTTQPHGEIWTKNRLDWCGRVGKGERPSSRNSFPLRELGDPEQTRILFGMKGIGGHQNVLAIRSTDNLSLPSFPQSFFSPQCDTTDPCCLPPSHRSPHMSCRRTHHADPWTS